MRCKTNADLYAKKEVLRLPPVEQKEVLAFLRTLEDDPFPAGRRPLEEGAQNAFYMGLPCGYFVGWEVISKDIVRLILKDDKAGCIIRVLGIGRERSHIRLRRSRFL